MKNIRTIIFALIFFPILLKAQSDPDLVAIKQIMERQTADWNRGDLDGFMVGYWESEELQFVGSKGVTKGYRATLDRYKRNYPDAASRGTLRFTYLHMEKIGKKAAFVVGKFHLARPNKGDAEGHFTLLWKKINGKWVIVADHSS